MKKKTKPASRSGTRRRSAPQTVEEYLARVPEPARATFEKLRAAVWSAMPKRAVETISYGIPAFKDGRVLVWFAAFASHCSLFPGASTIVRFRAQLRGFSTSKGTIHFPLDRPLPTALIRKLVKARAAENQDQ